MKKEENRTTSYAVGTGFSGHEPMYWATPEFKWTNDRNERMLTYTPLLAEKVARTMQELFPDDRPTVYVIQPGRTHREPPGRARGKPMPWSELSGAVTEDQMPATLAALTDGANLDLAAATIIRDHLDVALETVRQSPETHTLSGAALARVHEQTIFRAALYRHAIRVLEDRAEAGGHDPQFQHPVTGAILSNAARRFVAMSPKPEGSAGAFMWYQNPLPGHRPHLCCIDPDGHLHFTDATEVPPTEAESWKVVDR